MAIDIIKISERIEKKKEEDKKKKADKGSKKNNDFSWRPIKVSEYTVPKFNIPNSRKREDTRRYLSKVLAFIDLNKNRRYKDSCTIMPIPTTDKRLISICGNQRNVSRLIAFMETIGLISLENGEYIFGASHSEYNRSKTYRYYVENEKLVIEYCKNEKIDKFVILNGIRSCKEYFIDMEYFDPKEVKFSSKLSLFKPTNYSKGQFEGYLISKLYENYPWLSDYQEKSNYINEKYYSEDPELSIKFEPNISWNKGNKSVRKIGIRATNFYVSASNKSEEEADSEFCGYFKQDILTMYNLKLSKDIKSSVPRITLSINTGEWINEDIDIYEEIYREYLERKYGIIKDTGNIIVNTGINNTGKLEKENKYYTIVDTFKSSRSAIKNLHMLGYFDRSSTLGNHTCRKMGLYKGKKKYWESKQSEVYSEMALYQEAILKAEGGRLYDSEIFLHESCIYMDVLLDLLENGFFVWQCYDCWYARKDGVSQEEFEKYVTEIVKEKANEYIEKYREYILR